MVNLLLREGIDANCEDKNGPTPLFGAIQHTFDGRFETNKRVRIVDLLLPKGVDLIRKDRTGQVPLLYAVESGDKVLLKLLLEAGTDIEFQNDKGETALSNTVERGHRDVVELLLEWHANPECKGHDGQTPLAASVRRGNVSMVRILYEGGADASIKDVSFGKPALSYAAWSGYVSIYGQFPVVSILLQMRIDPTLDEDLCRQNPLEYAASNGHHAVIGLLSSMKFVAKNPKCKANQKGRGSQSTTKWFMIED
ncbi:hypothetical protein BBP40_005848 [Aspergillus hancockii]|nr:hypothetical protein BBP40_005848 [Aspergillus hancockii]